MNVVLDTPSVLGTVKSRVSAFPGDRFVTSPLFNQHVRLSGIRATKHRAKVVDGPDLIAALVLTEV